MPCSVRVNVQRMKVTCWVLSIKFSMHMQISAQEHHQYHMQFILFSLVILFAFKPV